MPVPEVLIASDSRAVRDEVKAVLPSPEFTVREVTQGAMVLPSVEEQPPDLVISDMQIGAMGGMALSLELRNEAGADRIDEVPVLLLLDRRADVFLAKRSESAGWLVKPLDPVRLRKAVRAVLAGGRYEDPSYRPAESAAAH
jgi:DNA-binding response OmpR family regulator